MSEETNNAAIAALQKEFAGFQGKLSSDVGHIATGIIELNKKFDQMISRREFERSEGDLKERVAALEKNQTWLVRLIVGAWLGGLATWGFFWKSAG